VRLVVCHTAEGARTYRDLGAYFQSPSAGVSSHVGIDDSNGVIGEYVRRDMKAWTQGNANPYSVAAELCAFAAWSPAEWQLHQTMLANTAQWVAEECAAFGIPLRKLSAAQAQGGQAGVCQHVDLGAAGGGHWDCGPGFSESMDQVIAMAAGGAVSPIPAEQEDNMMLLDPRSGGYWVAFRDGAVHAYKGAPMLGGTNNDKYNRQKWPCIGIAGRRDGNGYTLGLDPGNRDVNFYEFPYDGSARP
jgi:hypothetical protein